MTQKQKLNIGIKGKSDVGGKEKIVSHKEKHRLAPNLVVEGDIIDQIDRTTDLEGQCLDEFAAMKQMMKDSDKAYRERRELVTDTEYWFAVCFETREQKEMFLQAMGWILLGDKYLDGTQLARLQNIPLPKVELPEHKAHPQKRWQQLVDPDLD